MSESREGQAAGPGCCALCRRGVRELTRHHLIPRSRRDRKRRRADPLVEWETVDLCRPCHSHLHAAISERDLERRYPSVEALTGHPAVAAFTAWVVHRPDGTHIPAAAKKRR